MVICLTDEFAYEADDADEIAAVVITEAWEGKARLTVVDQTGTAITWINAKNAQRLVDFLTEEFDL